MLELIIGLAILSGLLWVGWKCTGALLSILIWLVVKVPLFLVFSILGVAFCVTLIFIPVGMKCFKTGVKILV